MSKRRTQVTIPEPYTNVESLRASVMALKELVESLAGQRGDRDDVAVTWSDLVAVGVIKPEQVPKDIGSNRHQ